MTRSSHLLVALSLLTFSACAGSPPQPTAPDKPKHEGVERYFPLGDGYVYTYETDDEGDMKDMLLLKVRRLDPAHAQLHTSSGVRELRITAEAIQRQGSGFVLRAPLRVGTTWNGDNGGTTRIDAVDVRVSVPAGSFDACIRTVEEIDAAGHGRITTVYCENVGIAQMYVEQWEGAEHAAKRFLLRSFGPPVDLDAK